jgi:hypothetical protein
VLFFQLIAEVGPARATVITYVNPAVAVALGVGVLGEPLTPEIIAAFGLILAGSVLATRSGQPAAAGGEHVADGEHVAGGDYVASGEYVAGVEPVDPREPGATGPPRSPATP